MNRHMCEERGIVNLHSADPLPHRPTPGPRVPSRGSYPGKSCWQLDFNLKLKFTGCEVYISIRSRHNQDVWPNRKKRGLNLVLDGNK